MTGTGASGSSAVPRSPPRAGGRIDVEQLRRAARAAGPALLFGLRLWASVCLALYVAFWLELDTPSWAGTTAAIVCQPHLGASLRKGWFRMIGTVVGAVAIVVMTGCFPQDRGAFLVSLALWGAGLCARRHDPAQLCRLCGGAGRVHRRNHRQRPARRRRRPQRSSLHLGGDPRQRDLHRHRLRRSRPRRNRFGRRPAPTCRSGSPPFRPRSAAGSPAH